MDYYTFSILDVCLSCWRAHTHMHRPGDDLKTMITSIEQMVRGWASHIDREYRVINKYCYFMKEKSDILAHLWEIQRLAER